jgi:formylglycine-generating enzyme required for sulfatase activity
MPSPLCSYPANGFGLADMIGNGREWTDTLYGPTNRLLCCAWSIDASSQHGDGPRNVVKGGAFF